MFPSNWSPEVGTTLIEHFGTPSLELRNGIRISILGLKCLFFGVRIVRAGSAHDFGTTLIEYFGSPSLELQNAIRISILEQKG